VHARRSAPIPQASPEPVTQRRYTPGGRPTVHTPAAYKPPPPPTASRREPGKRVRTGKSGERYPLQLAGLGHGRRAPLPSSHPIACADVRERRSAPRVRRSGVRVGG
jgi:hypothetical protein